LPKEAEDEPRSSGADRFNWDLFQRQFFGGGGWREALDGKEAGTMPWVDEYVKSMLAETIPKAAKRESGPSPNPSKQKGIAYNVFETHQTLIVRVRLTPETDVQLLRLQMAPNELNLYGLPYGGEKTLKLPVPAKIDGAKAICKQRILEVTLIKERNAEQRDIPIRIME
jgi:HSP20 family molecular chaperone IbpA